MITLFKSLALSALIIWGISSFSSMDGAWYYFVPLALILLVLFLSYTKFIHKAYAEDILAKNPNLFDNVEKTIFLLTSSIFIPIYRPMMEPQRIEQSSAVGFLSWISIPYCIYAGVKGELLAVFLSAAPFIYVYFGSSLCYCFYSGDYTKDADSIFRSVKGSRNHFLNINQSMSGYYLESITKKLIPAQTINR